MVRISGVVRLATIARQQLQLGIQPQEIEKFQKFVTISVQNIEHLCATSNSHPSQLPTPSRKAYDFLKQIDLNNLPLTTQQKKVPVTNFKLTNVIKQERNLHQEIWKICVRGSDNWTEVMANLSEQVKQIEAICQKHQVTPAALPCPSRSAYAWMKFLTYEDNLKLHCQTLTRARQIGENLINSKNIVKTKIFMQLCNTSMLYKCKVKPYNDIIVEMNEGFINASDDVLTALMHIALLGKNPQLMEKIRSFGVSEEYSEVLVELDLMVETTSGIGKGNYYDLDEIFDKLNQEYFEGNMSKPRLFWSDSLTTRIFGHYEIARNRVVISQTLDNFRIPKFVVEYVLYHELLHKLHGVKWVKGKPMVHTPEFRRDEQNFKYYHQGEAYLNAIARGDFLC